MLLALMALAYINYTDSCKVINSNSVIPSSLLSSICSGVLSWPTFGTGALIAQFSCWEPSSGITLLVKWLPSPALLSLPRDCPRTHLGQSGGREYKGPGPLPQLGTTLMHHPSSRSIACATVTAWFPIPPLPRPTFLGLPSVGPRSLR